LNNEFYSLKNWLLTSGLAISDTNNENVGGVYSYFDVSKSEYGFIYPEITGYFLSTLRFLYQIEPHTQLIEKSKQSADWLMKIYDKYGGIIQGIHTKEAKQKLIYSFDTGICAQGILDCYLLTKEEKYLDFAQILLKWLTDEAIELDGTIKPIYNLSTQKFEEDNSLWYKQKGCLHIKNVIPFCTLYTITNNSELLETINKICNVYPEFQQDDGSFSIHRHSKVIHMHTMCYSLEGLLHAFLITKNKQFFEVYKQALNWAALQIQKNGSVNLWFNSSYKQAKTSYHIAQLIRLMILADKIENSEKYFKHVKLLKSFLLTLHAKSNDPKINGGFYEENSKTLFGWKKNTRLNSWGSMFALQAIYWINNYEKITLSDTTSFLY